jgi:hypothetical protein
MDKIFQVSGEITKITTMSKNTIRIQFDSQENVSGEAMKRLFDIIHQLGNLCFITHKEIQPEDLLNIPAPKPDFENEKSDSQRMRNVLFRLWEQNKEGYEDFNLYYKYRMNKIIEFLKSKLEP